jgi:hypothetical protein
MTWTMGDLSNPGTIKVEEQAVAFYAGGNTPHVWTKQQVDSQIASLRIALWTYGGAGAAGKSGGLLDAVACRDALLAYGYPRNSKVVIDMEDHVDAEYIDGFEYLMSVFGYGTGVYAQADTIEHNPLPQGGRWVADWTGVPHFTNIPGEFACQWQKAGGTGNQDKPWDVSAVKDISGFWDTYAIEQMEAVLVYVPSGATRHVTSKNAGATWS